MSTTEATRSRERLTKALAEQGTSFEFVQAMRLLARLYPERAAIGGWDDPSREIVRLSVPPTLAFPPSEIASLTLPSTSDDAGTASSNRGKATTPARMAVRFLGLTGPQGVLPHVYTEHAASRSRAKDTAFRDFLDLFHHRALSLFYRAWERHRPAVPSERGEEDRMRSHLLDIAGVGTEGVRRRSPLPPTTLAYYAGLLALQSRPALGLSQLVSDYFRVAVEAEQFVGEWQPLRHGGQICLGDDDDDGVLGAAVVGNAVYDAQARVRLRIGPLTRVQFDAFLPDGAQHAMLCSLVRMYADDQVGVEAQLVLAQGEVPAAMLGVPGTPTLGFGSWLRSKPVTQDLDDVRLTLC